MVSCGFAALANLIGPTVLFFPFLMHQKSGHVDHIIKLAFPQASN
jgi:hypothetical protein